MVLLQGGVNLFQGENCTPTGWLDKPLAVIDMTAARPLYVDPVPAYSVAVSLSIPQANTNTSSRLSQSGMHV